MAETEQFVPKEARRGNRGDSFLPESSRVVVGKEGSAAAAMHRERDDALSALERARYERGRLDAQIAYIGETEETSLVDLDASIGAAEKEMEAIQDQDVAWEQKLRARIDTVHIRQSQEQRDRTFKAIEGQLNQPPLYDDDETYADLAHHYPFGPRPSYQAQSSRNLLAVKRRELYGEVLDRRQELDEEIVRLEQAYRDKRGELEVLA